MRSLGSDITVKATVGQTAGAYEVVVVEAERGGDILPHRHPWAESYYVLDGELEVQLGRRRWTVATGDLVVIPARAVHGFRVLTERASFLHTSIGPGATAMFEAFAEHFPEGVTDEADLGFALELSARHGVDVILEG
jgi:quercetin dioxygenase-like cupin family protein